MDDNIWIPSDLQLHRDPIAAAHVENPHPSMLLAAAGIVLPESDELDDEEQAALALAELDGDGPAADVDVDSGVVEDDDEFGGEDDGEPIEEV